MVPLPGSGTGNLTTKLPGGEQLPAMLKHYNVTTPVSIRSSTPTTGSLSAEVNMQQGNLETIARIPEIISMSPIPSMSTSLVDGNHISRKLPVNQPPQQYHTNRTRLHTTPSASTRIAVSPPNSNCSGPGLTGSSNSPGPIRHKSRRHETSPFERKPAALDGSVGVDGTLLNHSYTKWNIASIVLLCSVKSFSSNSSMHILIDMLGLGNFGVEICL